MLFCDNMDAHLIQIEIMKIKDRDFFITEKVTARKSLTPEGFLLCEAVPIARTGVQYYHKSELGIESTNSVVVVRREEDDVFAEDAMKSFEGKPVTIDHPKEFVNPKNWNKLAVGMVTNVRRADDLLVADLLITNDRAIKIVMSRDMEQVSCGYETAYEVIEDGVLKQTAIVGNHVALVERGRAGARCAIQDKEQVMKRRWQDRLMAYFKAQDEESFKETLEEVKDESGDNENKEGEAYPRYAKDEDVQLIKKALDDLTKVVKDMCAKPEEKTMDADTLAMIEVVAPAKGFKEVKDALVYALTVDETAKPLQAVLRGRAVDSLNDEQLLDVLSSASFVVAETRNKGVVTEHKKTNDFIGNTASYINELNSKFWKE